MCNLQENTLGSERETESQLVGGHEQGRLPTLMQTVLPLRISTSAQDSLEDILKEDTLKEDTLKKDTLKKDALKEDSLLKEVIFKT